MNKQKGLFITFEGSEGGGKSTQGKLLAEYLKSIGKKIVFLREPGGTKLSEKIRRILLNKANQDICPLSEMLLYMAARAQLIKDVIKPDKEKGYIVICDRFLDSTVVYQGYGLGVDIALIEYLGNFLTSETKPDLTIFLDVGVKKGLRACGRTLDRIEQRPVAYHNRVRKGYIELAQKYPERIKIIKPHRDKNVTQQLIRDLLDTYV